MPRRKPQSPPSMGRTTAAALSPSMKPSPAKSVPARVAAAVVDMVAAAVVVAAVDTVAAAAVAAAAAAAGAADATKLIFQISNARRPQQCGLLCFHWRHEDA